MREVKVWDGWVRLFHWTVVVLLGVSWWTAHTSRWEWHFRSGYTILTLVLFRIAWGLVGSETVRFRLFLRAPVTVFRHLRHLARHEADAEVSHNAAGGWMVLLMLALLLLQAGTGLFADDDIFTRGPLARRVDGATSALLTGIHLLNFNLILAAVALHVAAVLAYRLLKGQDLVRPMLTGRKRLPEKTRAPRLGHPVLGATLLAMAALVVWTVSRLG